MKVEIVDSKVETMKAIACTAYGGPEVLQLTEIEKPQPKENEVLLKIIATPITAADTMMRKGTPFYARFFLGLMKPKNPIPGTGFAGVIERVGEEVSLFQVGDHVFGETALGFGANAEYTCVPEDGIIAKMPAQLSFEEVAPVCDGAMTSLNFLRDLGNVQPGQKVLINGASGSLGTAGIQLAKYFGAVVTGVCSSKNVELVKNLGADHVIDYTTTDFTQEDEQYDIIYDTIGSLSFSQCKASLKKNGMYLCPVLSMPLLLKMIWTTMFGSKKAKFDATGIRPPAELRVLLQELKNLLEEGKLHSVIDRSYALHETVDAHRYVDTGHKIGNVILKL